MINVAVKYTERGVIDDTDGTIYENLERTKIMDCSCVIALPTMLSVKDTRGKACSFFYDKMTQLLIDDTEIEKFTMKDIVEALVPSGSGSSSSDADDSSSADTTEGGN